MKIQFLLAKDELWADKGYVQMEEQLFVKSAEDVPSIADVQLQQLSKLNVTNQKDITTVSGDRFVVEFDAKEGTIYSLAYNGNKVIRDGEGPKLDGLRAPVDNDIWIYKQWFQQGLHNLKHKVLSQHTYRRKDGAVVLSYVVESQATHGATIHGGTSGTYRLEEHTDKPFGNDNFKFITNQVWTVFVDGSIELASAITSNDPSFVLARLGYALKMPEEYGNFTYYGRGPINNYADRKTAQHIELHKSTVKDQFVKWPNPQSMSNNEEVRWSALTNSAGNGLLFVAKSTMSTSALPWSELEVTLASHPHKLPKSSGNHIHLDAAVTGLGGNTCGQAPPLEKDRVKAEPTAFGFIIRPVSADDYPIKAKVATAGDMPVSIVRASNGMVSLASESPNAELVYTIDNSAVESYSTPFNLRTGGVVTAWDKHNDGIKAVSPFAKIETVPLKVVYASSEETGGGAAKNLVDGNDNTIWHTMYSVTVAQYPHWVDFDAGEVKNIKGFTYLPRQDGGINGNIKSYQLYISEDGKVWSDVLVEGEFDRTGNKKEIRLKTPVKGRYIRFTGLSSHNGQDFASGAEFTLIAD